MSLLKNIQANVHSLFSGLGWSAAGHTIDTNVNFAKFMATAMCCDNGTTFPTSPNNGQWFLHSPTGRSILYQYSSVSASWQPIMSLGAMTVYVDGTNGTDSQSNGYGTGASAYKTIQYAVNQIPGLVGGNVVVNMAAGTYNELISLQGKNFTGSYSITLQGTWSQLLAITTVSSATQGSPAAHATLTVTGASWTVNAFKNKWLIFSANTPTVALRDRIYLVQTNTANVLTMLGSFDIAVPSASDTFTIQDQGAVITGDPAVQVYKSQQSVIISKAKALNQQGFTVQSGGSATFLNCETPIIMALRFGFATMDTCYIHGSNWQNRNIYADQNSIIQYGRCMIDAENLSYYAIDIADDSIAFSQGAQLAYNTTNVIKNATVGLHVSANASTVNYVGGGQTTTDIMSCTTGILADTGGQAAYTGTAYIKFTSCITNTNAVAATYGAIT